MIAIDTNIIVRFLTRDDETQFKKSLALFEKHNIFIANTVIMETEWVLRYAYNFEPKKISTALSRLFGLPNIHLSNPSLIAQAIQWYNQGMDFVDALHLCQCQQYDQLYTFDKKFIKQAKGLNKCLVLAP